MENLVEGVEEKFWSKVSKGDVSECWMWLGGKMSSQYGDFRFKGERFYTHRLAYQLHYKKNPGSLFVCHSCDNPACCNPHHLWLGTNEENMRDKIEKGRQQIGSEHHHAILNEEKVKEIVELLKESELTFRQIGARYGVSVEAISNIRNGNSWIRITGGKVAHKGKAIKLTPSDVYEIRRLASIGETRKSTANRFGVSSATVTLIVQGKIWKETI